MSWPASRKMPLRDASRLRPGLEPMDAGSVRRLCLGELVERGQRILRFGSDRVVEVVRCPRASLERHSACGCGLASSSQKARSIDAMWRSPQLACDVEPRGVRCQRLRALANGGAQWRCPRPSRATLASVRVLVYDCPVLLCRADVVFRSDLHDFLVHSWDYKRPS
jgi:hypothetical protein